MKQLENRTQIAMAMNFGKYPVLELDIEKPYKGWSNTQVVGYKGSKVRVPDFVEQGVQYYTDCDLEYWKDTDRLILGSAGLCLKASFGYNDVMEMLENANAPIVDAGQKFVLVIHSAKNAMVFLAQMKEYKNCGCQTVMEVEGSFKSIIEQFEALQ